MIRSFRCNRTASLFGGKDVPLFRAFRQQAERKLLMLENAHTLDDLRIPPGNRLEALKGDRKGQHSIRINDQFRICFRWTSEGPEDVEIVDYH
ncbi:MAG: type II toxin-antitoxin system RelE/ParE family toxin [Polyangiaceae bacterium]|nr:type II toxin-antitoxin system RelE/ParE family toxin [Polyangiaceae bacterium]